MTVLCFQVIYFRRVVMLAMCGYFNVEFLATFGVKMVTYRITEPHACVSTVPYYVAHPIEQSRYVLARVTSTFQINTPEPDVTTTR